MEGLKSLNADALFPNRRRKLKNLLEAESIWQKKPARAARRLKSLA